jgi:NitT/TauT family transport system permease protein
MAGGYEPVVTASSTELARGRTSAGGRLADALTSKWGLRLLSITVVLAAWQWYGSRPGVFALAPFLDVLWELGEMLLSGRILEPALGTLAIAAQGFFWAAVVGIIVGFATGLSNLARNTLDPLINAVYTAPVSMLIPVIGIWIGLNVRGKVFLVFLTAVFAVIANTSAGVREVDPNLVETARSFGFRGWRLYRSVILPWSAPFILVGLRLAVGRAIRGAIVADILLTTGNLGRFLLEAGSTFNMPVLLAGILFTMLLGYAFMELARWAERSLMRWRPQQYE